MSVSTADHARSDYQDASRALACARTARARFVQELAEFVGFESVSSDPARCSQVAQCATWLASHLSAIGLEQVRVVPTSGHPLVVAEWLEAPRHPTLLIYGHYDVQPPGPGGAWAAAFGAHIHGTRLIGRGAADDKGQMWAHLKGLECFLRTAGRLPLRVKCVFEGEEEVGIS